LFEYKFGKPVYVIKKPAKELHTLFVKEWFKWLINNVRQMLRKY
jgi:hypothetical protein